MAEQNLVVKDDQTFLDKNNEEQSNYSSINFAFDEL